VISIFSTCPPAATLYLIWVILDYTRSAIAGLSLAGLDPIYSFGDIVIFILCRFGLKFTPILGEFRGHISPKYPSF